MPEPNEYLTDADRKRIYELHIEFGWTLEKLASWYGRTVPWIRAVIYQIAQTQNWAVPSVSAKWGCGRSQENWPVCYGQGCYMRGECAAVPPRVKAKPIGVRSMF